MTHNGNIKQKSKLQLAYVVKTYFLEVANGMGHGWEEVTGEEFELISEEIDIAEIYM